LVLAELGFRFYLRAGGRAGAPPTAQKDHSGPATVTMPATGPAPMSAVLGAFAGSLPVAYTTTAQVPRPEPRAH
jgi:hypothetical protein